MNASESIPQHIYQNTIDRFPMGAMLLHREEQNDIRSLRILLVNRLNEQIIKLSRNEIQGKRMYDIFPAVFEEYNELSKAYERALDSGEEQKLGEQEYGDENVSRAIFEVMAIPVDKNHLFICYNDISEQRKAEEELRESNEQLLKKNIELERFNNIISHDLQEPLRTLQGFVSMLNKKAKDVLDPQSQQFLGFIDDGAKRAGNLIRDLLEHTRLSKADLVKREIDLAAISDQIREDLQSQIEEKGAQLVVESTDGVKADPTLFKFLLQSLITNSIKFSKDDSPPSIQITINQENGHHIFKVSDNGIGIDMKHQETVFGVFKRLNNRDAYPGTGIGLANCKKIVDKHGGKIWFESELGQGTIFYFTLPLN